MRGMMMFEKLKQALLFAFGTHFSDQIRLDRVGISNQVLSKSDVTGILT